MHMGSGGCRTHMGTYPGASTLHVVVARLLIAQNGSNMRSKHVQLGHSLICDVLYAGRYKDAVSLHQQQC